MKDQIEKLLEQYGLKSSEEGKRALQLFAKEYGKRLVQKVKEANEIFPKMGASEIRLVYQKDKRLKSQFLQDLTVDREEETIQLLNGMYLSEKDLEKEDKEKKSPSEVLTVHLAGNGDRGSMTKRNRQIGMNRDLTTSEK